LEAKRAVGLAGGFGAALTGTAGITTLGVGFFLAGGGGEKSAADSESEESELDGLEPPKKADARFSRMVGEGKEEEGEQGTGEGEELDRGGVRADWSIGELDVTSIGDGCCWVSVGPS
jgi:hypothetical protein